MTIWIDSREKPRAITRIIETFDREGVRYITNKLPVGDYMSIDNPRLVIDRKQSLQEVCLNVIQQRDRFVRELERAREMEIRLIILVEHGGQIRTLPDVMSWVNPRLRESPLAVSGTRLFKIMAAMGVKYGVEWAFCDKRRTGAEIIRLLGGDTDDGAAV